MVTSCTARRSAPVGSASGVACSCWGTADAVVAATAPEEPVSRVGAAADAAGPESTSASNNAPTSVRASFCTGPASGTGCASPPRRAARTSTATETTKNSHATQTTKSSTLISVPKVS